MSSEYASDGESTTSNETELPIHWEKLTNDTLWDKIALFTCDSDEDFWSQLLVNKKEFKIRFNDHYIESCKKWLSFFHDFMEEDETWDALLSTREKLCETIDDREEALLAAIDTRKHKILDTINWDRVLGFFEKTKEASGEIDEDEDAPEEAEDGDDASEVAEDEEEEAEANGSGASDNESDDYTPYTKRPKRYSILNY